MELLARYLERGDRNIVTLVRSDCHEGAQARIDAVLENLFGDEARAYRPRVQAVAADMTAPGLGLTEAERTRLGRARDQDRAQRGVGVVQPSARRGAGDQH